MLLGLLAPTVGAACKEHGCCGDVLENDTLNKLRHEQILVPDNIAGQGKIKEEMAITINWVSDEIDCCRIGFLPHTFAVQGSVWDGVICQVVEVFKKDDPSKTCRAKWHHNKGFARIAVVGTSHLPFNVSAFPGKKDKGVDGGGGERTGNNQ